MQKLSMRVLHHFKKLTDGFDQQAFLKMKESLSYYRIKLSQTDQEYGEISGNIKKINLKL